MPLVYVDESYINENHSFLKGWYLPEAQGRYIFKPSGKGRRIVLVAALTEKGWAGAIQKNIEKNLIDPKKDGTHFYSKYKVLVGQE